MPPFRQQLLPALLLICAAGQATSATITETKLTADDAVAGYKFGASVAISGTTAIVGATGDNHAGRSSGSAYLFDTVTGTQIAKLTADDAAAGDQFGNSVAISGTIAVVGASGDDYNGEDTGSAYLFDTITGTQIAKLTASDGAMDDYFGRSIAISEKTVIVGAGSDDDNGHLSGSAYLFDATTGIQIAKLTADDGSAEDHFGQSVAISGTTAIIGAYGDDTDGISSGSAYLFDTTTGSQIAKLTASDLDTFGLFGYSVAISGNTAIVGNLGPGGSGFGGSAYLFDIETGSQIAELTADDEEGVENFGRSVAISGTTAIVGAFRYENLGAAYLFDITTGTQIAKLTASDGALRDFFGEPLIGDFFGESVGISDATAIVGAYQAHDASGSAYLYSGFSVAVAPVPLPAGVWLLGSAALGLFGLGRRRRVAV